MYLHMTSGRDISIDILFQALIPILAVTGCGLVISQIVSNVRFFRSIKHLPYETWETVNEEIEKITKRGRFLLTKNVLIYYGMFNKKVYDRREISLWRRNKGIYSQSVTKAGRISVPYDNTVIYFKGRRGHMDVIEYPIDALETNDKTKGELPYTSFLVACVSVIFTASMIIYPRMLADAATGTEVERFLFCLAFEVDYFLGAGIVTAVSGLVAFMIRCIVKPFNLKKDKLATRNRIKFYAILLVVTGMFLTGAIGTWYEDAMLVREDLAACHKGELCVAEGRYKEKGACLRGEVGFTVYDYSERKGFSPVLMENPGYRLILLRSAFDELPEEGREYRVEYLEKTKIVVSFSEMTNAE